MYWPNMKWFNRNRTKMLDTDKVVFFIYNPDRHVEEYDYDEMCEHCREQLKKMECDGKDLDADEASLEVYVEGLVDPLAFAGQEAIDLYKSLVNKKVVLKG